MGHRGLLLLSVLWFLFTGVQPDTLFTFDFQNSLEGWDTFRDEWRWTNRASLNTTLPPDSIDEGFAVMNSLDLSDELYTQAFMPLNGGNFTMRYHLRSMFEHSDTLRVELFTYDGQYIDTFLDLSDNSYPTNFQWFVAQGELPPQTQWLRFGIFCFNGIPALAGQPMKGCALDAVTFNQYGDFTIPPPPASTTDSPSSIA